MAALEKAVLDLRGKPQWSAEDGRRVVEAWKASGQTMAAFARRSGLVPQRVWWWVNRLGRRRAASDVAAFVPVSVRSDTSAAGTAITVVAREGLRIEVTSLDGTSAAWVAALVRTLDEVRP